MVVEPETARRVVLCLQDRPAGASFPIQHRDHDLGSEHGDGQEQWERPSTHVSGSDHARLAAAPVGRCARLVPLHFGTASGWLRQARCAGRGGHAITWRE